MTRVRIFGMRRSVRSVAGWVGARRRRQAHGADGAGSDRDSETGRRLRDVSGDVRRQDYARLFEPDGMFASGPRGSVSRAGPADRTRRERTALQRQWRATSPTRRPRSKSKPIPGGAAGKAVLGNDGTYIDDAYVKTKNGWRFKLRQVITGQEKAATLDRGRLPGDPAARR